MKPMTLKKISAGIAVMLFLSQAVFVSAQENDTVYYENYFDNQTEMGSVFSGDGSTFSVENGMGKIVTTKPNGTARQVFATFDSNKPLHRVQEGAVDTLEVKVKFEKGTIKYLFGTRDNSVPEEKSNSTLLKFGDTTGNVLRGADDVDFVGVKMTPNEWQHLYFVFNNDSYDLYIDGNKANTTPVNLKGKTMNPLNITQIDKLLFQGNKDTTVQQTTWIDDFISQKLVPICLTKSTIADNASGVSVDTKQVTLDFNTIIDANSLSALKVYAGERELSSAEYTAAIDKSDATKVVVTFVGNLTGSTVYKINYTGVRDVINEVSSNEANGQIQFTTEAIETPFEIVSAEPISDVGLSTPVVITFNKAVSPEGLEEKITLNPSNEFTAVVDGTKVTISPKYNWLANKTYEVSFDGLTALDGTVINNNTSSKSFSTVADPYAAAAKSGDFSWYSGGADKIGKVDAAEAKAAGVCGVSYGGVKEIDMLSGKTDLPFVYRNTMGSDDDVLSGNMLYLKSKNVSECIVYEVENGLGEFILTTGEKTGADSGVISFYTADEGQDFTDDSVYTQVTAVKSNDLLTDKWNGNITYKVTMNDPKVKYIKVVISKQPDLTAEALYIPVLMRTEIKPYTPKTKIYKAINSSNNTVDVTFDGLLDKSSVAKECFTIKNNEVMSAKVIEQGSRYRQTVRLTLKNKLTLGNEYNVSVTGVKDIYGNNKEESVVSFTAQDQTIKFENIIELNGSVSGTINIPTGNKSVGETVKVIAAYYENDCMKDVGIMEIALSEDENNFKVMLNNISRDAVNTTVKVMLWTSLEELVPLCEAATPAK